MTTINPNELKAAREWLNYLPEPIKSEAVEACEKWPLHPNLHCKFVDCISYAIFWDVAGDYDKWREISDQLKSDEILPVSPEAEQPKPEMVTYEEAINRLRAEIEPMKKEITYLHNQFLEVKDSMKKLFNEITPILDQLKQDAKPMPEPKPLKLPVTIEESDNYYNSLADGEKEFLQEEKR